LSTKHALPRRAQLLDSDTTEAHRLLEVECGKALSRIETLQTMIRSGIRVAEVQGNARARRELERYEQRSSQMQTELLETHRMLTAYLATKQQAEGGER
jgi:hypothetical protein